MQKWLPGNTPTTPVPIHPTQRFRARGGVMICTYTRKMEVVGRRKKQSLKVGSQKLVCGKKFSITQFIYKGSI